MNFFFCFITEGVTKCITGSYLGEGASKTMRNCSLESDLKFKRDNWNSCDCKGAELEIKSTSYFICLMAYLCSQPETYLG